MAGPASVAELPAGTDTKAHEKVSGSPSGSVDALPSRWAVFVTPRLKSAPAFAIGARFAGLTSIATSSLTVNAESLAVSRRTYGPASEKDAVVVAAFARAERDRAGAADLAPLNRQRRSRRQAVIGRRCRSAARYSAA